MFRKSIFVLSVCYAISASAQAPSIQWQKNYGGTGTEGSTYIERTNDGGFILGGTTQSNDMDVSLNHGDNDFWAVKLDNTGTIQWEKTFGGSMDEQMYDIHQTLDGGYIMVGAATSVDGNVNVNNGGYDAWIVKIDANGTLQWQHDFGGTDEDWFMSVTQNADSSYLAVGYTSSADGDIDINQTEGYRDALLVKFTPSGNYAWERLYGGPGDDEMEAVKPVGNGYIVAGGTAYGGGDVLDFKGGLADVWVLRLDSLGDVLWNKCYGGTNTDFGWSVINTTGNGFLVGGSSQSNDVDATANHGGTDMWLLKLNDTGAIQWQHEYGGKGPESVSRMLETNDGGYAVVGYAGSSNGDISGNKGGIWDAWVVKVDNTGSMDWQKCLGGSDVDMGFGITTAADGGLCVSAQTNSNDSDVTNYFGMADAWVVKLNPTTGIADIPASAFHLFPNPATGVLHLSLMEPLDQAEVTLETVDGRTVRKYPLNGKQEDFSISDLAPGSYLLKLSAKQGTTTQLFVKQ
jgi:hypothetical protein